MEPKFSSKHEECARSNALGDIRIECVSCLISCSSHFIPTNVMTYNVRMHAHGVNMRTFIQSIPLVNSRDIDMHVIHVGLICSLDH